MGAAAGTLVTASDEQGTQMVNKLRSLSTLDREPLLKALADENIPEATAAAFVAKFIELNKPGVSSADLWKQIRPPGPADGAAKPAVRVSLSLSRALARIPFFRARRSRGGRARAPHLSPTRGLTRAFSDALARRARVAYLGA